MSSPRDTSPALPAAEQIGASPADRPAALPARPSIAVSATFTAEPIEGTLAFWIEELGWEYQVRFAPYNQVFQQLLDRGSLLAGNRNGISVVLVRLEDWGRTPGAVEENVRHFISGVRSAVEFYRCPLVVCVCPPSPGFLRGDPGRDAFLKAMDRMLVSALEPLNLVHLITAAELSRLYPVQDYYDPHGDELGHMPYTPAAVAALATAVIRKIHAMRTAPFKAIVLDCDETLWQGVCGEDGPSGVRLDAPRRALQEFMAAQRAAGVLLCLCSKNNEEDVIETFRSNPDWPLQIEDFVARRINWEPKSAGLVSLAEELNLGLDSFIFLDDNPTECAEVQANCPEVLALPLPKEPDGIPKFLNHVWAFDRLKATREDKERAALYVQEIERGRLEKKAASLEEFLAGLKLEVSISEMLPEQLPRVSQLTQRTNQMNFTTIRRSEADIQALLREDGARCLTVDVRDRFGSYGLVGVILYRAGADAIKLDTFLLSCRALGRGIEHRMLAKLGQVAETWGIGRVDVPFVPTARNSPALAFLESIGGERTDSGFRFPAALLSQVTYRPGSAPAKSAAGAAARKQAPSAPAAKPVDFVRIATELWEPDRILNEAAGRARRTVPQNGRLDAPRTQLERRLAEIWAELLRVPAVGINDSFFDLGGHSLLAVQLLSRVRQEFKADLSLGLVYSGPFTVAELAKTIDMREIEQADAGEYAAILEELEGLSDEQVRALLAEEQSGDGHG